MDLTRSDLLDEATAMAEQYRDDGYSLTLRQLYYALVSEGLIPNSQNSYKRLGDVLGNARLEGDFEMDLIVDRGREAGASAQNEVKTDVDDAEGEARRYIRAIPHWAITIDRWFGQRSHVSVWVEKEALSGVFDKPCSDLGVGFFACKGYPSHSALWQWLKRLEKAVEAAADPIVDEEGREEEPEVIDEAVVLYFGDHDPDGWQIPRSAEETLNIFARIHGLDIPPIRFERVALNMDQILKYKPPPFPAKLTSSRYAGYRQEHGIMDAWELDALKPKVLDKLIRDSVAKHWDEGIHQFWQSFAADSRERLRERMTEDGWTREVLE